MCEEYKILRLYCKKCDNTNCKINSLQYSPIESKNGCSKKVDIENADKFFHYIHEVLPFWKMSHNIDTINRQYQEIISFLDNEIYCKDSIHFYDKDGNIMEE